MGILASLQKRANGFEPSTSSLGSTQKRLSDWQQDLVVSTGYVSHANFTFFRIQQRILAIPGGSSREKW
jgi:hypothetical protein